jgi:hypothetical protein
LLTRRDTELELHKRGPDPDQDFPRQNISQLASIGPDAVFSLTFILFVKPF